MDAVEPVYVGGIKNKLAIIQIIYYTCIINFYFQYDKEIYPWQRKTKKQKKF